MPLIIIPCENADDSANTLREAVVEGVDAFGDESLKRFVIDNMFFLDCVVDKICRTRYLKGGRVEIVAEPFGDWVVKRGDAPMSQLNRVCTGSEIVVASNDSFLFYKRRKAWLMTGVQLAIATLGFLSEKAHITVRDVIDDEELGLRVLRVQYAFGVALHAFALRHGLSDIEDASFEKIVVYNEAVWERIKWSGDDIIRERLLRELVGFGSMSTELANLDVAYDNLQLYIHKVKERLIAPISEFGKARALMSSTSDYQKEDDKMLQGMEEELRMLLDAALKALAKAFEQPKLEH